MRRARDELERRGIVTKASADEMIETYVAARLFAEARAFHRAHRHDATVAPPAFDDLRTPTDAPTLLHVLRDGARLQRRAFLLRGMQIVVVGSPWCAYSRAATDAIARDTALASVMAGRTTWVIPQQIVRDVRSVARWNHEHPAAAMAMMYRNDEWPFVRSTATPSFHFFRDGRLVASFSGWAGDAAKESLVDGLRAAGLVRDAPGDRR